MLEKYIINIFSYNFVYCVRVNEFAIPYRDMHIVCVDTRIRVWEIIKPIRFQLFIWIPVLFALILKVRLLFNV